ncbi:protein Spindly [Chanos chanos]|uniref:Protein Spindly n=1 Tax=Chanos chanos TaxID=29144 RepID=A0A6J2URV1_CHACN|nr:protein Spindly [Chanos chanos]
MLDSLRSEFDAVKSQQKQQWEQQQAQLERGHALELSDLKSKLERMKAEKDEAQLIEKQLRHKLELQSEALSSKTEELRLLTERAHETMSSEILELQVQRMELESSLTTLEQELQEAHFKEEQLQLLNTSLQRQLERLTEEKEEREKEAVSCYNALEKAREANQELQIQLEQVLQQAQDPNSKGNSLFSEVEDKRAEMERQLISMKVQYQSLQKQHAFSKQQMHRMKVQIATLMQLQGSRADPAQLERLQFMLLEKNNEIESLMMKVRQLEKAEVSLRTQCPTGSSQEPHVEDETYYTDLLKMQLSNSRKDTEQLKDELSMQRMKSLSESQRVLEMERKLFGAERALKQSQSDNIKLQIKLEELRLKYEPNEVNKGRVQKRRREKLPVDAPEDGPEVKKEAPALEGELVKNVMEKGEEEPLACAVEEPTVAPPSLPERAPAPSPAAPPPPRDSKCVRISEEPPITIPDSPRSSAGEGKNTAEEQSLPKDEEQENRRTERNKRNKSQAPIHVVPEKTMENQCAQQ